MRDNELDKMLEAYYSKTTKLPEKTADCPSEETLARYVLGDLGPHELYQAGGHVKSCVLCSEMIEAGLLCSVYGRHINTGSVPDRIKNKAKALHPAYKKEHKIMVHLKRNIWIVFSLASLIASFFIARYFIQFLILALIFGLKWVFNKESARALIMVYNAWRRHDRAGDKEMEDLFKNRL